MKNVTLSLLAAAAMGAVSIGSGSAMPVSNLAGLSETHVKDGPGYGYYGGPRVGIGVGPVGVGIW